MKFTIPIRTRNPLNGAQGRTKGAVFAKAARRKKERRTAWIATCAAVGLKPHGRAVTMTRISAGTLDGDGLQAALKSVRDGIADALGVNDGGDAVSWVYAQRKGKRGEYAVEVEITSEQPRAAAPDSPCETSQEAP